ncbi:hypothetical protein GJ496_002295 [Pomphorhynchus laevis]|nr:hypothetical protein GJ496_002295 [Pomphorhynchus laevis]
MIKNGTNNEYDSLGAFLYISAIVIWYSVGLFGIIIKKFTDEQIDKRRKVKQLCYDRGILAVSDGKKFSNRTSWTNGTLSNYETLEILALLGNTSHRTKLWEVYYGDSIRPPHHQQLEAHCLNSIRKRTSVLNSKINTDFQSTFKNIQSKRVATQNGFQSPCNRNINKSKLYSKRKTMFTPSRLSRKRIKQCLFGDTTDLSAVANTMDLSDTTLCHRFNSDIDQLIFKNSQSSINLTTDHERVSI